MNTNKQRVGETKKSGELERETGFEPATPTLARLRSTTELFPLFKEFSLYILEILHMTSKLKLHFLFPVKKLIIQFVSSPKSVLIRLQCPLVPSTNWYRRRMNTPCEYEEVTTKEIMDMSIRILCK